MAHGNAKYNLSKSPHEEQRRCHHGYEKNSHCLVHFLREASHLRSLERGQGFYFAWVCQTAQMVILRSHRHRFPSQPRETQETRWSREWAQNRAILRRCGSLRPPRFLQLRLSQRKSHFPDRQAVGRRGSKHFEVKRTRCSFEEMSMVAELLVEGEQTPWRHSRLD
jgi:hypothetical protein